MAPSPSRRRGAAVAAAAVLAVLALPAARSRAQAPSDDMYPADITPPAGTQYHCALTALPRDLPGIPSAERAYINRTYARVLRATQAKLVFLKALEEGREVAAGGERYQATTRGLAERLSAEPAPVGLAPFQEDVGQALALQQAFFLKAASLRQAGRSMAEVYQVPEG